MDFQHVESCETQNHQDDGAEKTHTADEKMEKKKGLDIMKVRGAKIEQKWVGGERVVHELAKNEQKMNKERGEFSNLHQSKN